MLQRGCLVSPELSCNQPRWGRESWLLCLSSWCLVIVVLLFIMMPQVCLQFVIVVFLIILTIFDAPGLSGLGLQYGQMSIGLSSV